MRRKLIKELAYKNGEKLRTSSSAGQPGCKELLLLLIHFSCVQLLVTPWTTAYQVPPSMGFSRHEYWSGVPLPSPM